MIFSIRQSIIGLRNNVSIRCYHDSRFLEKPSKMVKLVGKDAKALLQKRVEYQKASNVIAHPKRIFEPFPFKVTEENKIQTMKNILTPLHDIPYEEQLSAKTSHCKKGLRLLTKQLYLSGTSIRQDVSRLPCRMKPMIANSRREHYRTKDEFGIWKGIDGETDTVGFWVFPISKHGDTVCVEPDGAITMKPDVIKLAKLCSEFIQRQKKLGVCYDLGKDGGWRRFIVRNNHLNELMLIGIINPTNLKIGELMDEKVNFRDFMIQRAQDAGIALKSLFIQATRASSSSHEKCPFELLHGEPVLEEKVKDLKVLVCPESHLQDNISSLESLMDELKDTVEECFEFKNGKPIILDAMCGSGILAMSLANLASQVIGIDHVGQSIEVARQMAEINGISNCQFIRANIEVMIERLLEKLVRNDQEVLLIANTPKKGLLPYVATALRNCKSIKKIIYITPKIDHENCQKDLLRLCQKESGNTRSSPPFIPIQATPLDMLPHCEGCYLILALQRVE